VVAVLLIAGISPLRAQAPPPTAEEQARFVKAARHVAMEYSKVLPDFLCTETIKRLWVNGGSTRLRDTITVEVSFRRQKDQYAISQVNGRPAANSDFASIGGMVSSGEFGANMVRVFDSDTKFRFEKWTTYKNTPAAVYSYQIHASEAHYQLMYMDGDHRLLTASVGLRGEIVIDRETSAVLRIQYLSYEVPSWFRMQTSSTVEYDWARLNDQDYLLPSAAAIETKRYEQDSRNEVEFHSYRKFSSDSRLTFGDGPREP
jgi:hypothetical protein